MGFSLSVLAALVLLMPGAAFVFAISRLHRPTKPASLIDQHFSVGLLLMVLAAVILHAILLAICSNFNLVPDPAQALALLAGDVSKLPPGIAALHSIVLHPYLIATYLAGSTVFGWAVGKLCDLLFPRQSEANWYELLTNPEASFVVVTIDVVLGNRCHLFTGVVQEFSVSKDGDLERLVLGASAKKLLGADAIATDGDSSVTIFDGWREVSGEFLVLQMRDARTVCVDYFYVDRD